jgi:uncharacterized protein YjbJ (UPF0337 family)
LQEIKTLNWDRVEGQWKQRRGKAVHHWGKIMNDELAAIAGKYEELVGKLQESYGIAKDEAGHHVKDYKIIVEQLKKANLKLIRLHKTLTKKRQSEKRHVVLKSSAKKRR